MFVNHAVILRYCPHLLTIFFPFNLTRVFVCVCAGFIDFIVEPTFSGLVDTAEKVIGPLIEEERKAKETGNRRSRYCDTLTSPMQPMSSAQVQEPL